MGMALAGLFPRLLRRYCAGTPARSIVMYHLYTPLLRAVPPRTHEKILRNSHTHVLMATVAVTEVGTA